MHHRSIALASSLFVMGCGAAAPEPGPTSPTPEATAAPAAVSPAKPPEPAATAAATSAPAASATGKPNGAAGSPGAAVVDNKDPLSGTTLSQEDIRKIIEKNGAGFDECYILGAGSRTKAFSATITVQATLGPTGAVNVVKVIKSTAKDKKVDTCVGKAFKQIKFPAPNKGGTSVITFPLSFDSQEVTN